MMVHPQSRQSHDAQVIRPSEKAHYPIRHKVKRADQIKLRQQCRQLVVRCPECAAAVLLV